MAGVDPARLVFLDETSTPTTLTPVRARAARGQRAHGRIPRGRREAISWLATLTTSGLGESLLVRGAVDRLVFEAFVERVLVPTLRPGQIVILDNLSVHKSATARACIAAAGCHLVFLPTYSPDLNPIEPAWSKLKTRLRTRAARSLDALETELGPALATITADDAHGWFRHCGYHAQPN